MTHKFNIPQELYDRAAAAAALRGVPLRRFLLDAMLEAVENVEDYQAAERAMAQIESGEDQIISSEEFWGALEVDDSIQEAGAKIRRKA